MREAVSTPNAPAAIGPYSQAIRAGDFLFVSGQIPLDPATGTLIQGDIAEQTHRVLRNLAAILDAAGASFHHVVKTTVYLADMSEFAAMNEVYGTYFPGSRTCAGDGSGRSAAPRRAGGNRPDRLSQVILSQKYGG